MPSPPSLEELIAELRRRGLPAAYIERLTDELRDHLEDLIAERSDAMSEARMPGADLQKRIGQPIQLAKFTAEQYHGRSFLGRHPILTFLVAPLPLMVLGIVAIGLALMAIGWATELIWNPDDFEQRGYLMANSLMMATICWAFIVLPPTATVALMCRIGRRNALGWRWPIVACVLVAFICAIMNVSYRLATNDHYVPDSPGNSMLMIGFFPFWAMSVKGWLTYLLPKFALALGVGLLLVRRAQQIAMRGQPEERLELRQAA